MSLLRDSRVVQWAAIVVVGLTVWAMLALGVWWAVLALGDGRLA